MIRLYILDDDGNPVRVYGDDLRAAFLAFGAWFAEHPDAHRVALDQVGGYHVSTVFLGLDSGDEFNKPPRVFETMTFNDGGPLDGERYSTRAAALKGHARHVAIAQRRVQEREAARSRARE